MRTFKKVFLLFLVTLLCCVLIFLLVLFIKNHRSTKNSAKQIFGIDLDDYDVASVEDTLKWYSYGGALRISLSLHSDEELEQLLADLSGLGYAFDKEDVAENGAHVEEMIWIRQLWFVTYRYKHFPSRYIGIVPNEDGYTVRLWYSE